MPPYSETMAWTWGSSLTYLGVPTLVIHSSPNAFTYAGLDFHQDLELALKIMNVELLDSFS